MTRFQLHCIRWKDGCGSDHCAGAVRRVLYRGDVPCDILFVGEAPGESENVLGVPFIGPAGRLLNHIVGKGVPEQYRRGFTNVVGCIPREGTAKAGAPDKDQTATCLPRLEEILDIANPRLIVCVGNVPRDALAQGYKHSPKIPARSKLCHIMHPAAILRSQVAAQGLQIQRCIVTINDEINLMENPPAKPKKSSVDQAREDYPAFDDYMRRKHPDPIDDIPF